VVYIYAVCLVVWVGIFVFFKGAFRLNRYFRNKWLARQAPAEKPEEEKPRRKGPRRTKESPQFDKNGNLIHGPVEEPDNICRHCGDQLGGGKRCQCDSGDDDGTDDGTDAKSSRMGRRAVRRAKRDDDTVDVTYIGKKYKQPTTVRYTGADRVEGEISRSELAAVNAVLGNKPSRPLDSDGEEIPPPPPKVKADKPVQAVKPATPPVAEVPKGSAAPSVKVAAEFFSKRAKRYIESMFTVFTETGVISKEILEKKGINIPTEPTKIGKQYLAAPEDPIWNPWKSKQCKFGDQCHNKRFKACPCLHPGDAAKAGGKVQESAATVRPLELQMNVLVPDSMADSLSEYEVKRAAREALFGKAQVNEPEFVGCVKTQLGYVNCTFVKAPTGPALWCVFVEHVLPEKWEFSRPYSIEIRYGDQTWSKIIVMGANLKRIARDLVALNISVVEAKERKLQFGQVAVAEDAPVDVWMAVYPAWDSVKKKFTSGRYFNSFHNCATLPGNCSAPVMRMTDNKVIAFHQGAVPQEKVNCAVAVTKEVVAALLN